MMQVREQAAEEAEATRKGKRKSTSSRAAAAKKVKQADGAPAPTSATKVHPAAALRQAVQATGEEWVSKLIRRSPTPCNVWSNTLAPLVCCSAIVWMSPLDARLQC